MAVKYLNNKELLKEIHRSKKSYCSFRSEEDSDYDFIIHSLDEVDSDVIRQAKEARAKRLQREKYDRLKHVSRVTTADCKFDPNEIRDQDLVFRLMTFDHIPLRATKKKTIKTTADLYTPLKFPPFQHYGIDEDDFWVCVGKSHWTGGVENGWFCQDHGKMTDKLVRMFMTLCQRYGSRGNWRGYSYNEDMKAQALLQLSQVGLKFDESKGSNPFAYYTQTITNSFTRVLNNEKKSQSLRDDLLEAAGQEPSYTRQNENESQTEQEQGRYISTQTKGKSTLVETPEINPGNTIDSSIDKQV